MSSSNAWGTSWWHFVQFVGRRRLTAYGKKGSDGGLTLSGLHSGREEIAVVRTNSLFAIVVCVRACSGQQWSVLVQDCLIVRACSGQCWFKTVSLSFVCVMVISGQCWFKTVSLCVHVVVSSGQCWFKTVSLCVHVVVSSGQYWFKTVSTFSVRLFCRGIASHLQYGAD